MSASAGPDRRRSPRFAHPPTFMRLPVADHPPEAGLAVVGVPYDGGASFRPGARFAPRAVREASTLMHGVAVDGEADLFERMTVCDLGDVDASPFSAGATLEETARVVAAVAKAGAVPAVIGGDHSVSLGVLRGTAQVHGPLGLLHFDAHSDTNPPSQGGTHHHGTPFRWAIEEGQVDPQRAAQVGIRGHLSRPEELDWPRGQGVHVLKMHDIVERGIDAVMDEAVEAIGGGPVHVSYDIDVVDPAFAPGTGTPAPGGLNSREALRLARRTAELDVVSFDLVEVAPPYDPAQITAFLAASLVYELASAVADRRHEVYSPLSRT